MTVGNGNIPPSALGGHLLAQLSRLNDQIERVVRVVVVMLFAGFICVVFLQVMGRNLLRLLPLIWTIDVSILLYLWSVYLGAALAVRRNEHYIIDIVPPDAERLTAILDLIADVLVFVVLYVLIVYGIDFLDHAFTRVSLAIGISEGFFYLAIPTSAIIMTLFLIEGFSQRLKRLMELFGREPAVG